MFENKNLKIGDNRTTSVSDESVFKPENISKEDLIAIRSYLANAKSKPGYLYEKSYFKEFNSKYGHKNEIENFEFGIFAKGFVNDLTTDDLKQMRNIYDKNYEKKPKLRKKLLEKFDDITKINNSRFYLLKYKGKIISFNRFDTVFEENGDVYLYFGSFNVDQSLHGNKVCEIMMQESLNIEAKEMPIKADSAAYEFVSMKYIEAGFVANKFYEYEGEPSLSLERDDAFVHYKSKEMSKEEIIEKSKEGDYSLESNYSGMLIKTVDNSTDIPFEKINSKYGYVITRYFKEGNKIYVVFEKVKNVDKQFAYVI